MLLLRQKTQPLLDACGLTMLHTEVIDKTLTIVGECGQPLVAISGIKFSRNTLSADEREYAAELFDNFMKIHSAKIVDFVTKKQALAAKGPIPDDDRFAVKTRYNSEAAGYIVYKIEGEFASVYIDLDQNITEHKLEVSYKTKKEFAAVLTNAQDELDLLIKYVKAKTIRDKEVEAINQLKSEISTCTI